MIAIVIIILITYVMISVKRQLDLGRGTSQWQLDLGRGTSQ